MATRRAEPTEIIRVSLDDAAVDRLRCAAEEREVEVEQLIVDLLYTASYDVGRVLPWPDSLP